MNYNKYGDYAAGIGNWAVSVNKQIISDKSGCNTDPQWLNDYELIYQNNNDSVSYLEKYNIETQNRSKIDSIGASYLYARNNVWIAQLSAFTFTTRFSSGAQIHQTRPWSVGYDGTCLLSNLENNTLFLYNQYGVLLRTIYLETFTEAFHTLSNEVSYKLANGKFYWNESLFNLLSNAANIKQVGNSYLCYQTGETGVLHNDQYMGWKFGTYGKTYLPDAFLLSNGDAEVAYAENAAEIPSSIKLVHLLDSNETDVRDIPKPIPMPIKNNAYPRRIFFCPYQSYNTRQDWGVTSRYIGNVVMPDRAFYPQMTLPLIQPYGQFNPIYINTTLAYYVHANPNDLQKALDECNDLIDNYPEKPIIFYLDGDWRSIVPLTFNMNKTWLGVQAYRDRDESIEAFGLRIDRQLDYITDTYDLPIVLTPMFFDRGYHTESQIIECMPIYDQFIREYFIIGVMPFSDCRPGGMKTYPILYDYAQAIYDAIPERPNRYDYWVSDNYREDMKRQLDYSSIVLSSQQRKIWKDIVG